MPQNHLAHNDKKDAEYFTKIRNEKIIARDALGVSYIRLLRILYFIF